jgi:alkylation response protein AidB-like acyl-CoA dehydrogenase
MTWVLDEQQRMLRDSAQAFVSERAPVAHLRSLRNSRDAQGYSPALWAQFAEQGYCATLVPEAHGGLGLTLAEAGLVAEEVGHTLAPTPFIGTAVLAAVALARGGSPAQQAAWLPRIAAGEAVLALALDEGGRHRPDRLATTAAPAGEGWVLNGRKALVVDGHVADALLVVARAGEHTGLWLVPKGTAGLNIERTVMLDAHNAASVHLSDVRVGADALLGPLEGGAALLAAVLNSGRAVIAAEALGLADEVFARTVQYLKERKQFDRIIGEFQALQHRAAELFCDLELTRALVRQALKDAAADPVAAERVVAQAKARACLTVNRAVQEGVQMHGGIGMTDELDMGLFMKRARMLQEWLGDASYHMDRAARLTGY